MAGHLAWLAVLLSNHFGFLTETPIWKPVMAFRVTLGCNNEFDWVLLRIKLSWDP